MEKRTRTIILFFLLSACASAQETLFSDNFDACTLSDAWTVSADGNTEAVWYVGTPGNENSDGSSIDGTCLLLFDDDETGENTPPWSLHLASAPFDASGWAEVTWHADVHFRNYNGQAALEFLAFDGAQWQVVAHFQGAQSQTGEQFSSFATVEVDLTFYAHEALQIGIRYDDGGTWAWWAGVDNIRVEGHGQGSPVLLETFNNCALPEGWATQAISGSEAWSFGFIENENAGSANSMNGSCMAYFDDDGIGQNAPFSKALLLSPIIDGLAFSSFNLYFDAVIRQYTDLESLSVGVQDVATGELHWAYVFVEDQGGPQFDNPVGLTVDLSALRSAQMRLAFLFDDGNGWGWWAGLDNIKLIGSGTLNDLCSRAITIEPNTPCLPGDNRASVFTGPEACAPSGQGSLWYQFAAAENEWLLLESGAEYNDAIALFAGSCESLEALSCASYDQFGFTGESILFQAEAGQHYFFRVQGQSAAFGQPRGQHCISLSSAGPGPSPPPNDLCADAIPLVIGTDCTTGTNRHATFGGPSPMHSPYSKADIWFTFTPTAGQPLLIESGADFADVLTVYRGSCGNLEQVASNERGQELHLDYPEPGTTYWLQVSGFFATLEGQCCVQISEAAAPAAANNFCEAAPLLALNEDCTQVALSGNNFNGPVAACALAQSAIAWYRFQAPPNGMVSFEVETDFVASLNVFSGECGDLEEIYCSNGPDACLQNNLLAGLTPGAIYYLRVGANQSLTGYSGAGTACLKVNNAEAPVHAPLSLFANLDCFSNGKAVLALEAEGGTGGYTFQGLPAGTVISHGEAYFAEVTDAAGCTAVVSGTVYCPPTCALDVAAMVLQDNDCPNDLSGAIEAIAINGSDSIQWSWQNGHESPVLSQAMNGLYTIVATDLANGCRVVGSVQLGSTLPIVIAVLSTSLPSPGQADGAIAVSVSGGAPPYHYEWMRDGQLISEAASPSQLEAGAYTLQVTDGNGCALSYGPIVLSGTTPVAESSSKTKTLTVYPNPGQGLFYMDIEGQSAPVQRLEVYDAAGQLIWQKQVPAYWQPPYAVHLPNASSGLYVLRAFTSDGAFQGRLVLAR